MSAAHRVRRLLVGAGSRSVMAAVAMVLGPSVATQAAVLPIGPHAAGSIGQFGAIKGRLVYGGPEAPAPKVLIEKGKSEKDGTVCAVSETILSKSLVVDAKSMGVKYAFAYVVRPKGSNPDAAKALVSKAEKVVIDQKNCEFLPYAVAIHQDQTLEFKSSDPVNHNVHINSFNAPFNQIMGPAVTIERKMLAERRPIPLTCDIHPWMKGWIMVFDHTFFAVTAADGSFEIQGVPAGEQKVVLWQELCGYVTPGLAQGMAVTVEPGKTTDLGEIKLDPAKIRN